MHFLWFSPFSRSGRGEVGMFGCIALRCVACMVHACAGALHAHVHAHCVWDRGEERGGEGSVPRDIYGNG